MLRNRLYYSLKPLIPRRLQIAMRSQACLRTRAGCGDVWPINEKAAAPPAAWSGWPEGKKFALVLTHDVDTARGQDRCKDLSMLEERLGFRSSFNFVPERYAVSPELRTYLANKGFEIGVHGLRHDGKYYCSRKGFLARAKKINHYLKDWAAVGYRAPSMLHKLEWFHDLDIEYDASTFDTDPFEPNSTGMCTIFPFFVQDIHQDSVYVELPYTLPQDFTLFVLMREKSIDIWKRKLDWVAERGGMALINTHPDYTRFGPGGCGKEEYMAEYYQEFLEYIKSAHGGEYWHVLPRDLARFWTRERKPEADAFHPARENTGVNKKIWIDLDNSPHVPFFRPIIRELTSDGYGVTLTARDCSQTCGLADLFGMRYQRIGRHFGKNKILKVIGLLIRVMQLVPFALKERPALALSHGSRAQLLLAHLLRIPSFLIGDYEHARKVINPTWMMVPEVIDTGQSFCGGQVLKFSGIKEDVYVPEFKPSAIVRELGLDDNDIVITVRPPATEAHYHNPESEVLFQATMERLSKHPRVKVIIVPRNSHQETAIKNAWEQEIADGRFIIPDRVIDGLDLIWHSDIVISGGGTMNREAAALGVPVYSIFRGKIGAVDRYLAGAGRLVMLDTVDDVRTKIRIERRVKDEQPGCRDNVVLRQIVAAIEKAIKDQDASIPCTKRGISGP
jgi:predicted glycosyltransferase